MKPCLRTGEFPFQWLIPIATPFTLIPVDHSNHLIGRPDTAEADPVLDYQRSTREPVASVHIIGRYMTGD